MDAIGGQSYLDATETVGFAIILVDRHAAGLRSIGGAASPMRGAERLKFAPRRSRGGATSACQRGIDEGPRVVVDGPRAPVRYRPISAARAAPAEGRPGRNRPPNDHPPPMIGFSEIL